MRFLTWLLGVFVVLLAIELTVQGARGWLWVWILAAVVWFFAGAGLGVVSLVQLASGKMGAGALPGLSPRRPPAPAPHKEE